MNTIIPSDNFPGLTEKLACYEREYIIEVLRLTGGNVAAASRLLKMNRPNILWRKLKRIGINANNYKPQMDTTYQPEKPSCPICDPSRHFGFPELEDKGTYYYCYNCKREFSRDDKLTEIWIERKKPPDDEPLSELEILMKNKFGPGGQHAGKTVIGPGKR